MITNERALELHDRSTRGLGLSSQERAELDAWYATQDRDESERLGSAGLSGSVTHLETQVNAALAELHIVTERIQRISEENHLVRQEIASLQQELAAFQLAKTP